MKQRKKKAPSSERALRTRRPKPCFCGGAPLTHTMPYVSGESTLYHIECGACFWSLRYQNTVLDFTTEAQAIAAWDAALQGELSSG